MINDLKISIKHNFVTFTKTPAFLILATLPIIMLLVFGSIYPATNVLPHIITISIITVSFSFVGIQFIEYRQNRFFRNNKSISMPNTTFILGTFITLLIILSITSITLLNITWFLTSPIQLLQESVDNVYFEEIDSIKYLLSGKPFFSTFEITNIDIWLFSYSMLLSIVMTSLFAIMLASLFSSVKSYTVLTLSYLILYIVLGGLALPYNVIHQSAELTFLSNMIPNTHTNNLLTAAMNQGHVDNAYDYVYFTEAVCDWLQSIIDLGNEGELFPQWSNEQLTSFNWMQDLKNPNGVIQSGLNAMGMPEIEEGWLDPLQSALIFSAFPWVNAFIQTVSEFLGLVGISEVEVLADKGTLWVLQIWYVSVFVATNTTDFGQAQDGFYEVLNVVYNTYSSLGESLELMIRPNPFTFDNKYGIITNAVPFILILLTLPNFIIIGREE